MRRRPDPRVARALAEAQARVACCTDGSRCLRDVIWAVPRRYHCPFCPGNGCDACDPRRHER